MENIIPTHKYKKTCKPVKTGSQNLKAIKKDCRNLSECYKVADLGWGNRYVPPLPFKK